MDLIRKLSLGAAAMALSVGFAASASAATITTVLVDNDTPGVNFLNPLASSVTGDVFQNVTGSIDNVRRSPWEGTSFYTDGVYTSVSGGATAEYDFTIRQIGLSFVWGSPDDYNDLEIVLMGPGGTSTTINGTLVMPPEAVGANLVTITDVTFDRLIFTSGANAFEFANLAATPIPLPAPALMLLTGMGALGGVAALRRRREAKS